MKKLAIFVEGNTELLFVDTLLNEIVGEHNILIEHRRIRGGKTTRRTMRLIDAISADTGQDYFVLLLDCGGDRLVKDRILEEHENLTKKDYTKIIGIRDVRPEFTRADIPKLESGLRKYIKTSLIPVEFVLSVMEIEAWFLAEFHHYPKIDPAITVAAIRANLGFDPEQDDMSQRSAPADDLDACYGIARKTYTKEDSGVTVAALDYPFLYLELPNKIPYLKTLIDGIDSFLA